MTPDDRLEIERLGRLVATPPPRLNNPEPAVSGWHEVRLGSTSSFDSVRWGRVFAVLIVAALLALSITVAMLVRAQPDRILVPVDRPSGGHMVVPQDDGEVRA